MQHDRSYVAVKEKIFLNYRINNHSTLPANSTTVVECIDLLPHWFEIKNIKLLLRKRTGSQTKRLR